MKSKYNQFFLYLLIILSLLVVSCDRLPQGSTGSTAVVSYSGTKGVTFQIIDDGWNEILPSQQMTMYLEASNHGSADTQVKFLVDGNNEDYLEVNAIEGDIIRLNRKVRVDDNPYTDGVTYNLEPTEAAYELRDLPQNLRISACYLYETNAQINLFADLSGQQERVGSAQPRQTLSTSQGQGAPVGISVLEYQARPKDENNVLHRLLLTLEQFDTSNFAEVYDSELGVKPCETNIELKRDVKNLIKFPNNAVEFGQGKFMNCELQVDGKMKISTGDAPARVSCSIELPRSSDTVLPVKINFKYGMRHTLQRDLAIINN